MVCLTMYVSFNRYQTVRDFVQLSASHFNFKLNLHYIYDIEVSCMSYLMRRNCLFALNAISTISLTLMTSMSTRYISRRAELIDEPYIENILEKYNNIPNIKVLALGSPFWPPPSDALESLSNDLLSINTHKYGSILGMESLRTKVFEMMQNRWHIDMNERDIVITAGANQAFVNIALTLLDESDSAGFNLQF